MPHHEALNSQPSGASAAERARARPIRKWEIARGSLAAGHAHVARDGRTLRAPVDDEVVALRLARDGFVDRLVEQLIAFRGPQVRPERGGVLLPRAHIERARAGDPHAVPAFAEIMRERRDEAEPAAGL